MEHLLVLLAFPLIWPFVAKYIWQHEITWKELTINVVSVCALVTIAWYYGHYAQVADTEILNGQVTSKAKTKVTCEHSYTVCTGSGKSQSCTVHYEHSHDWDWRVKSNVNEFNIDRIDRQGNKEPPRFTKVKIGDPVAATHDYVNYIKGAPNSLFNKEEYKNNKHITTIPQYPMYIHDYHYINRVIDTGVGIRDFNQWNLELANRLREVGPKKHVNVVIIMTKNDKDYADAIRYKWLGGKKNDVIVIVGVDQYPNIKWVEIVSWSKNNIFHVALKDELLSSKELNPKDTIDVIIKHINSSFVRMAMSDYKYLEDEIELPNELIWLLILLAVGGSVAVSIFMKRNDI